MAVAFPIVLIIVGEVVLPQHMTTRLHDRIVMDTQSKLDDWISEEGAPRAAAVARRTHTHARIKQERYSGVTVGHALLSCTPPPPCAPQSPPA